MPPLSVTTRRARPSDAATLARTIKLGAETYVAFAPWQLFVRPAWWGTGLAAGLHDAFLGEARGRGYRDARLNTRAAHARARRFYERRGWSVAGPPSAWRGLPVAEYRCSLQS